MKDKSTEKVNKDTGLSQERFETLFNDLDEAAFKALLAKAGLTEEMADEIIAEAEAEEAADAKQSGKKATRVPALPKQAALLKRTLRAQSNLQR